MKKKIVAVVVGIALVLMGTYAFFSKLFVGKQPEVAIIGIEGSIDNFETSHRVAGLIRENSVKAVVLEIDSPGGYVSSSFQLEEAISQLSEAKPTVAIVGDSGASGAYLAASAADNLYVHRESLVGSLGVIAVWVSYENYYAQEGIEHFVFETGEHKDMFAPWRGPTENEKGIIRNQLYRIKDRMILSIENNRPSLKDNLPLSVVTGEVVRGFQAVDMNLADGILLTNHAAVEKATKAADLEDGKYDVVRVGSP